MSGYEVDRRRFGDSMRADVMSEQASIAFRFDRLFMTLANSLSLLFVMVALAAIPSSSVALVVVRSATLELGNAVPTTLCGPIADIDTAFYGWQSEG
ncbi:MULTISPECIES: hypothetical protein [Alphaproteobacteria]|uniref:hypothetical protein n=1 Tax=Alphaproteobacteria TaxID=28211 RepID=UPI001120D9B3|nr:MULTISPECIES: hypothetical protein [Alphaproteobacteria]MBC7284646.1 hypothetical protein [Hoeflea sp.]